MSETNANIKQAHMESFSRVSEIPVVKSAWTHAAYCYGKVKSYNSVVNKTLSLAESTLNGVVEKARPVASKIDKPLHVVDDFLCKSLDYVEDKVPAVKLPPNELYENTKTYISTTLQPVVNGAEAIKTYSMSKVNSVYQTNSNVISESENLEDNGEEESKLLKREDESSKINVSTERVVKPEVPQRLRTRQRFVLARAAEFDKWILDQSQPTTSTVDNAAQNCRPEISASNNYFSYRRLAMFTTDAK